MGAEVFPFPARRPAPANLRDTVLPCGADQLATLFNSLPKGRTMSDFAEEASSLQDQHLAASLSRINPAMAKGVEGDCDNCGDHFERLVGGLCGYCRDGRRRPMARPAPSPSSSIPDADPVGEVAPTPVPGVTHEEEVIMPNPKPSDDFRNVSILARGELLKAITERADERDLSLNKAAASLIEDAIGDRAEQILVDLSKLPFSDLLEEVADRLSRSASSEELASMTARAEAAEARLAQVQAALGLGAA